MPVILSLYISPQKQHERTGADPFSVFFYISKDGIPPPSRFDPNDDSWQEKRTNMNWRDTNYFFNELQELKVADQTLPQFIRYKDISLWQFLPSYIWPQFFRAIELIKIIDPIVNDVQPQILHIFPCLDDTAPIWDGTLKAIGAKYGIKVRFMDKSNSWSSHSLLKQLKTFLWQWDWVFMLVSTIRNWRYHWLLSRIQAETSKNENALETGKKLLFLSFARHWVRKPNQIEQYHDEQLFPLLPALRIKGWQQVVVIDCPYSSRDDIFSSLRSRIAHNEPGIIWRLFFSYRCKNVRIQARKAFRQQLKTLFKNEKFFQDFHYLGVCLLPALKVTFQEMFTSLLPECAQLLSHAEHILIEERPQAVIASYEAGPFQRALIIQAGRMGVPTIGLMHGMIFHNHYDYMHHNIIPGSTLSKEGFTAPDVTCVWGEAWKNNLTKVGSYPEKSVAITGNWRYDWLSTQERFLKPKDLRKSFGIDQNKRVVFILSANYNSVDFIRQCLRILIDLPKVAFLIKQHPVENPGPVREMLLEMGISTDIYLFDRFFEAMFVSDLVISQFSTAISEAIFIDKPVIAVNFTKQLGWEEMTKNNALLYVDQPTQLSTSIDLALNDTDTQTRLAVARNRYIHHYFFQKDRKSAERVVTALDTLCVRTDSS